MRMRAQRVEPRRSAFLFRRVSRGRGRLPALLDAEPAQHRVALARQADMR